MEKVESELHSLEEIAEHSLPQIAPGEIVLGTIAGLDEQGRPLVEYSLSPNAAPFPALSTVAIDHSMLGRQVALLFSQGDKTQPVIVGLIHSPLSQMLDNYDPNVQEVNQGTELASDDVDVFPEAKLPPEEKTARPESDANVAYVDGSKVVIEGKDEVVLKCGESSITLTKAGKVLVRGKYLMSRSKGVNRIMGGSVQVN